MKIFTDIDDRTYSFDLIQDNGNLVLKDGKAALDYQLVSLGKNSYSLLLNGKSYHVQILRENGTYHVHLDGDYFPFRVEDERMRKLRELVSASSAASGERILTAPIPGLVTNIRVAVGDQIQKGQSVIVLEAMKMENELKAEADGTIKSILIEEGNAVDKDQQLLIFE